MKTRLLFLPLLFVLVASLAACGGSTQSVPADAVAVVNGTPITVARFNAFFKQAVAIVTQQGGTKPSPGTPQYTQIRNQVVAYLVQFEEVKQQAPKEGVSVTDAEVSKFLTNLAKTNFKGSMKKLEAALKKQGLTMDTARQEVFLNLLGQKLRTKVTSTAKVTQSQDLSYYNTNITQYSVPAETTRDVRHILVAKKSLANTLENEVTNANFARLAKKYSIDTTSHKPDGIGGSAANGGKLTAVKGQLALPFQKVAFSLKTGQISAPVHSQFGWHIIQALGPVKNVKAHTTPFSEVKATIESALLQQAQEKLWQQWLSDLQNEFKGKVSYQSGYAPPTTTALPTTTNGTPTG